MSSTNLSNDWNQEPRLAADTWPFMRVMHFERFLGTFVVVVAALYLAMYVMLAIYRLGYPFELEWMEGGSVDHVVRILSGQPLYAEPSIEFVAYAYTPLYYYLSALLAAVIGVGFLPLRLISWVASLANLTLIFFFVQRETRRTATGLLAAGMFAATYRACGSWFDLARVDSLFLAFLLAALYCLKRWDSATSRVAAGLLTMLSFLTKQTALVAIAPLVLYTLVFDRQKRLLFPSSALGPIAISTLLFNIWSKGWYNYYVFTLPAGHSVISVPFSFWAHDMALFFIGLAFGAVYLYLQAQRKNFRSAAFYGLFLIGGLLSSWLSRLSTGGYHNVLFPAYAAAAVGFGLGVHAAYSLVTSFAAHRRVFGRLYVGLLCLIQLAMFAYDPRAQIPTVRDWQAGTALIQTIAHFPGEVFVPYHGYLCQLAGKKSHAQQMAIYDVLTWGPEGHEKEALVGSIKKALSDRRFDAIIDDNAGSWLKLAEGQYVEAGQVFKDPDVFWPISGNPTRPEFIYVARAKE